MNEEIKENTKTLAPFTKLCMTIGQLPASYVESMSYYEQLIWFTKFLQDQVIPAVNQNAAAVEELQGYFLELQEYVNNYFDNLDVQEEINNKLDEMAEDGSLTLLIKNYVDPYIEEQNDEITAFKNSVNAEISAIDTKVDSAVSGSPLVASSTAGMTDTERVYVNTTDGKWYYYDGDSWEIGGTYQSTGIAENGVGLYNINEFTRLSLYKPITTSDLAYIFENNNNTSAVYFTPIFIKKGTTITASETFLANFDWRFRTYSLTQNATGGGIFSFTNNATYTFTQDYLCMLDIKPTTDKTWDDITDYDKYALNLTNNDIEINGYSIINYIKDINDTIDIEQNYMSNFLPGSFSSTIRQYTVSQNRKCLPKIEKSSYPLLVKIKSGWKFGVQTWSTTGFGSTNYLSDSGWKSEYIIPANTYFTIVIGKSNDANIQNREMYENVISVSSCIPSSINNYVNNYIGEHIDMSLNKFNARKYGALNIDHSQGMAIYDNYVAIYMEYNGDHYLKVYNKTTLEAVANISIDLGHGDVLQFSNTFYNDSDLLPLLYVTSDSDPGYCHIVRVSNSTTASIIKSYKFETEEAGYYQGYTCDFVNNKLYSIGYKINSFTNDSGNASIVCVYDLNNETLISEGVYSLELLETYELPFIYTMQGMKWFNGKIFVISSYTDPGTHTPKIYVINPYSREITSIINNLPSPLNNRELEDLDFVIEDNKYVIYIYDRIDLYILELN